MSMNCYALRLSQFEVASVKRNPASASRLTMAATLGGIIPRAGRPANTPNLLLNLELLREGGGNGRLASPLLRRELARQIEQANAAAATAREVDPTRLLDLHKSWHVLHYLFTGELDAGRPPADALLGGRELGDDMGYGPPRLHDAASTAAFSAFLEPLTANELKGRIDLARMRRLGVYCCEDADEGSLEELNDDVEHYFPQLRSFVAQAAEAGGGMLVWLS
jgi:hypothetical protein